MNDYLIKAITKDDNFRVYCVNATELVQEAHVKHDTWVTSTAALGRTLIGTLLISSAVLKGEDKITVRLQGDGPAGSIIVDGNAKGTVKGYIQEPHVSLDSNDQGKIDVKGAVGTKGMLSVTKDQGLKEPFTGQVGLVSGEIAEDFTYYMAKSEQTPSAIGLSVFVQPDESVDVAGGFLVQTLPGASEQAIDELEEKLKDMPLVSELLRDGKTPEQVIYELFNEDNVKILEKMPVKFECDCSKERFKDALASIDKKDIKELIEQNNGAETVCKFCGKKYNFSAEELKELL
ncbi:33 kDa chaperonin [Companilactobacillus sp. RD055328]|uniref:Hsp33 family molecular chaperone HslO n=1 Tax=Companilactobacillus sp. RD055328 TaxID=2916634 RepID=UPI001FC8DA75|nr:Hsp33 family molecular chaperone HslO [Companilactobacillus sp. RD055328]GKQ42282.1 33 kDa chaperonin [Companilactobacillus sp. RD055328]